MDNLKVFRVLLELINKARASGMAPGEIACCFFFALESLGEEESGMRPGYVVVLRWLEEQRSAYLARLAPGRVSRFN
jgi:hypothetical protein